MTLLFQQVVWLWLMGVKLGSGFMFYGELRAWVMSWIGYNITTTMTLMLLRVHFNSPQPDASLRCKFPGSGLVNRENVSVVAAVQSCS